MYLPPYGYVWAPGGVDDEWRPYYNGRWIWLPLTAWTWLPYEPWGWATFHYGRWHWGTGIGWYWIPTSFWGPAWVNWWWDYDYFAWAPMSWWGYPVVIVDGYFYGRYYDNYYPYSSRALTVVHRDQLKNPNVSKVALRGDRLKSMDKISLASSKLTVRPEGNRISVQSLDGKKIMLRTEDRPLSTVKTGSAGKDAATKPSSGAKDSGGKIGSKSSGASQGQQGQKGVRSNPEGRKIRKKDDPGSPSSLSPSAYNTQSTKGHSSYGYPSSPNISARKIRKDFGGSSSGSFVNRFYRYIDRGSSYQGPAKSGSSTSSRISSRSSSSSRGSSSSVSRSPSSSSRSGMSSGSRSGSSSGSRGGGSVRKK